MINERNMYTGYHAIILVINIQSLHCCTEGRLDQIFSLWCISYIGSPPKKLVWKLPLDQQLDTQTMTIEGVHPWLGTLSNLDIILLDCLDAKKTRTSRDVGMLRHIILVVFLCLLSELLRGLSENPKGGYCWWWNGMVLPSNRSNWN